MFFQCCAEVMQRSLLETHERCPLESMLDCVFTNNLFELTTNSELSTRTWLNLEIPSIKHVHLIMHLQQLCYLLVYDFSSREAFHWATRKQLNIEIFIKSSCTFRICSWYFLPLLLHIKFICICITNHHQNTNVTLLILLNPRWHSMTILRILSLFNEYQKVKKSSTCKVLPFTHRVNSHHFVLFLLSFTAWSRTRQPVLMNNLCLFFRNKIGTIQPLWKCYNFGQTQLCLAVENIHIPSSFHSLQT